MKNYFDVPIVTVSDSTRYDLLDLGFKNVKVVPEGLNFNPLDQVPEKERYPVIAYVGRLKRAKRPDHAVKAFKIIKQEIPNAELWVIGDGYFRRHLEKTSTDGVKFFGHLNNVERRDLIKRAWVLVNPSVREGFGLNVVEANALGTPCTAYDVEGLRDSIMDDETGLLVRSRRVKDLADKIVMILMNTMLREKLSQKALDYSKQFGWDKSAEVFLKILQQILSYD